MQIKNEDLKNKNKTILTLKRFKFMNQIGE